MGDKEGKRKELVRPTSSAQASSSSLSDNPSGVQSNEADPPSLSAQTKTADGADRKRIYRACEICRRKKIRCDGLKPCKACVRMSESCVFLDDSSKTMYSKKTNQKNGGIAAQQYYAGFVIRKAKGLLFVGSGVSGGEEGARHGPSLMPGGSDAAWPEIKEIFQKTAAQSDGEPCCDWVGQTGAGHYVKMVHNGIEYGDMQLIGEAYDILKRGLGLHESEIADIFTEWNTGVLDSFLIEITRDILKYNDDDGEPLVTKILDSAGQKGTGKWTAINALDLGQPVTLIG
ncbi:unnamed protein product [Tilletia controversa]|uniref:phosphogluconate dehydrogenase (NADP(+)-dependent, decarboxylating) n=1 Tax=Tilletia controversa TaxID=13291 RepID=A0A8X7MNX8_9BASI|nr:hypothetical protein A4X06_0g6297 [Tilletia controversa]CAD6906769.1 unnamed protein product [Tilletia controversa]CAD6917140.1 unnamed protein product [Tilletia controversa]CAD6970143.1 unnamed protein product [Tilletia controversa]